MSSKIYGKLAITNLKNNRKSYVPYILMAVLSVMMYYIVGSMAQGNNGLSENVKMIMGYMNGLLMIFSVIFLFYTNSFLIKRRKREIGIYNILGMGKGHIAKMLAIEAVITAFISIFGGILLGIVFGKLMYLVLGKLLHYDFNGTLDFGVGFSYNAEAFFNFSWFGVFMAIPLGKFLVKYEREDSDCSIKWNNYVKIIIFRNLIMFPRQMFFEFINSLLYQVLFIAGFIIIVKNITYNMRGDD